jgi:hypothetical protein
MRDIPDRFKGAYFEKDLIEPRKQVSGIGDPAALHLSHVPYWYLGVWESWIEISDGDRQFKGRAVDPENPPIFESQAAYLDRHELLTKSEKKRLKQSDWRPISLFDILPKNNN